MVYKKAVWCGVIFQILCSLKFYVGSNPMHVPVLLCYLVLGQMCCPFIAILLQIVLLQ